MERIVVWKLDNFIKMEHLPGLLRMNHSKNITFLENEQLDSVEKIFRNRWITSNANEDFRVYNGNILGQDFKYIYAIGSFEYGYGEKKSYINGILLDRDLRIFNKTCKAVFFDYQDDTYVALQTNKSNETVIRSSLMGQGNGNNKIDSWGKVDFNEHYPFSFPSEFFYWLLSKKGSSIDKDDQKLEIYDVSAVAVFSDHEMYNTSSEGEGLLEGSVAALSVLSTNETIKNVGLIVKLGKYYLDFRFNSNAEILIDEWKSYYTITDEQGHEIGITRYEEDCNEFIVLLFTVIFPTLINEFAIDATWDSDANLNQQKQWALSVIKKLMGHSNISLEDLQGNIEFETDDENVI